LFFPGGGLEGHGLGFDQGGGIVKGDGGGAGALGEGGLEFGALFSGGGGGRREGREGGESGRVRRRRRRRRGSLSMTTVSQNASTSIRCPLLKSTHIAK
jgi:hypothetical protein